MAVPAYAIPDYRYQPPRRLRLMDGVQAPHRPAAAVFWRRRIAVLILVSLCLIGAVTVARWLDGGPLATDGSAGVTVDPSQASYVVQPGDTYWDIARGLQPDGDIRPLVDRLQASRGAAPLQAGELVNLPAR